MRKNNTIVWKYKLPRKLKRYFLTNMFFASYTKAYLSKIDESILNIVPTSFVAPIIWASGCKLYVDSLDETFYNSLVTLKKLQKMILGNAQKDGDIIVGKLIKNKFRGKHLGLLFSGGVDSTASFIRNMERKPILFYIWGVDIPYYEVEMGKRVMKRVLKFAREMGVRVRFVRSNARDLNEIMLSKHFRTTDVWWSRLGHTLILLGLVSPLTYDVNKVLMAATIKMSRDIPIYSCYQPQYVNSIAWADVKVRLDGSDMARIEKMVLLAQNPKFLK